MKAGFQRTWGSRRQSPCQIWQSVGVCVLSCVCRECVNGNWKSFAYKTSGGTTLLAPLPEKRGISFLCVVTVGGSSGSSSVSPSRCAHAFKKALAGFWGPCRKWCCWDLVFYPLPSEILIHFIFYIKCSHAFNCSVNVPWEITFYWLNTGSNSFRRQMRRLKKELQNRKGVKVLRMQVGKKKWLENKFYWRKEKRRGKVESKETLEKYH